MCFFVKLTKDALTIENRFKAKFKDKQKYCGSEIVSAFEFKQLPVITNQNTEVIEMFSWGLIPEWSKNDEIKKNTLNAKIETINEKPSFRYSVNNRCIILVDGFYEWQWLDDKGKQKQKYLITLSDNQPFALAGIWSMWKDTEHFCTVPTFTIVTTEANVLMSEIHNSKKRMPVVLSIEKESEWLNKKPFEFFFKVKTELFATKV